MSISTFAFLQITLQLSKAWLSLVGFPIKTFYEYQNTFRDRKGYERYADIINEAKEIIALSENAMAMDGKIPTAVWTLRAKNYQGMRDVTQIEAINTVDGAVPTDKADIISSLPELPSGEDTLKLDTSSVIDKVEVKK